MKLGLFFPLSSYWIILLLTGRLDAQTFGGLDPTYHYSPGASAALFSYAVGTDGRIIVGGSFTNYHGLVRNGVARLNADGSLDTTFDPKAGPGPIVTIIPGIFTNVSPGIVSVVEVQTDGRVLAAGAFSTWAGLASKNVLRLNTDGSVDTTFNSAINFAGPMLALPDGKILVAGKASDFKPARKTGLGRLNADGSMDATFADSALGTALGTAAGFDFGQFTVSKFARQSDGKIVVLMVGTKVFQITYGIGRLNADGSHDAAFHVGLTTSTFGPTALDVDGTGRVIVGNIGAKFDGQIVGKIFRLLADGSLDTSYAYALTGSSVSGVAAFPDGSAILSGAFDRIFSPIIHINADGSHDDAYGLTNVVPSGNILTAILSGPRIAPDRKVFVYGTLLTFGGGQVTTLNSVFRLTDGGSSGGNVNATPPSITTQPANLFVDSGKSAAYSVVAAGTAPLSYQWRKDSNPIPGATNDTFSINFITADDGAGSSVVVTNAAGSVTS